MRDIKNEVLVNKKIRYILSESPAFFGRKRWYLGAGAVAGTVWNIVHGFDSEYGIKDYDLVYWDDDISQVAEDKYIKKGK